MHQELEGYEQAAADQAALKQGYARLQAEYRAEIAKITARNAKPKDDLLDDMSNKILVVLANLKANETIESSDELSEKLGLPTAKGMFLFKQLTQRNFIAWNGSYIVTIAGLEYMAKHGLLEAKPDIPPQPSSSRRNLLGGDQFR